MQRAPLGKEKMHWTVSQHLLKLYFFARISVLALAAFLAYSAISVLRQQVRASIVLPCLILSHKPDSIQIKPTHRVHGIVEGRDWAANGI